MMTVVSADPAVHVRQVKAVRAMGATAVVMMNVSGATLLAPAACMATACCPPSAADGACSERKHRMKSTRKGKQPQQRRQARPSHGCAAAGSGSRCRAYRPIREPVAAP